MQVDDKEDGGSQGHGNGPATPPRFACGHGHGLRGQFRFRKRKRNHGAALRADGQMAEELFALMRGKGMLDEGADLVGVRMVPELERVAHGVPGSVTGFASLKSA